MSSSYIDQVLIPNEEYRVQTACDPQRSAIVSACAGSGKTWLLIARMVRLLLAGVKPNQILALTFTRKAAQEMRDRLYSLLEQFSKSDDLQLLKDLEDRGLSKAQAITMLPTAKLLYSRVLANPQPIVVDTFHGWFGKLLGAAPVSIGIQPGYQLREDAKRLQEECLADWWSNLTPKLKEHYDILLKYYGSHETQKFLMGGGSLFKQRGAWTFFVEHCKSRGITPIEHLEQSLPLLTLPNPLLAMWSTPNMLADLEFLADVWGHSSIKDSSLVTYLQPAMMCKRAGGELMEVAELFQFAFLTKGLERRASNGTILSEAKKYLQLIARDEQDYIACKQIWGDAFISYLQWKYEQEAYALNRAWFALSEAMMDHATNVKDAMRVRDFDDLEIGVSKLMSDAANAAYLQSRLDAKYEHILIDEFQDTNPLQWQILRSWLEGYGQDTAKPSVFIVGDPKQSIYRFRRADPRLFTNARHFLQHELGAASLEQNTTRRNAPKINEAVNHIFQGPQLPLTYPFSGQKTAWNAGQPGRPTEVYGTEGEAYILPLIPYGEKDVCQRSGSAFDKAIIDPGLTVGVAQRYQEGQEIGKLITNVMATRLVADKQGGKDIWRPARESDFLLLVKRRRYLPEYERALRDAGLAYESSRLGGLLNTLEVDDLIALLSVLVTPRHDLPLAQVLRSPIFGFAESQMQQMAIAISSNEYRYWWDALQDSPDASLKQAGRYLEHWRILGERLPVHDLLDCIYQESNLRIKYAAISKVVARPQVLANLDAFLELALNQDGGRYPSLSRFISEINDIRRGDDDETPDEGDVDAASEENLIEIDESEMSEEDRHKRVRMMTIHGAKGLEAPFVIMLDANNTDTNVDYSGVLMDWSPQESNPSHLSLFTAKTLTSPRIEIYEAEKTIGENENWNLLYVAMTRARQGLWMSGNAQKSTKSKPSGLDESAWYGKAKAAGLPVFHLANMDLPEQVAISRVKDGQVKEREMSKKFSVEDFVVEWDVARENGYKQLENIENGLTLEVLQNEEQKGEGITNSAILEEGVHFHKLLEVLTIQTAMQAEDFAQMSILDVSHWLDINEEQARKALNRALTVINTESLRKYLFSNEWVQAWNEIDIVNGRGKSFRLDRLVEFDDYLAIIDYKLTMPDQASEKYAEYQLQLSNYKQELGRIRKDKPAKAYLISADGQIKQIG